MPEKEKKKQNEDQAAHEDIRPPTRAPYPHPVKPRDPDPDIDINRPPDRAPRTK